ncbi:MAG: polysaccharide deacetylase family protein [Verrucomicrobiales bacterium]|nr:polysaccharide deacetylase family protein [Verrucomicrobiales bacterium]
MFSLVVPFASALEPIPDKLVVLGFDDCNKSDRAFVAGVLKEYGFGATFYVTEGLGFLGNKRHYVTWNEIKELHDMGFEIGNHTKTHPNVTRISREKFSKELEHIEARCAQYKITKPTTFAYPGFSNDLKSVQVLKEKGYHFSRRGVGPEFKDSGSGSRGPVYDPSEDHPLLIPTTGYAGPKWGMEDLKWAISKARNGKIAVICFHGVPALDHPWVNCDQDQFREYMKFMKEEGCVVISTRDLSKYVDYKKGPTDPYGPIKKRTKK